jgi:hypothetical protein
MRHWFLLAAVVIGCADDYAYRPSAESLCDQMITAFCSRNVECGLNVGAIAQADALSEENRCEDYNHMILSCASVYPVMLLDACKTELANTPCSSYDKVRGGIPTPTHCVVETPAQ